MIFMETQVADDNFDDSGFGAEGMGYQPRDQSIIRWMEDLNDELVQLNNYLEGKVMTVNDAGDEVWILNKDSKPKMNTMGRSTLISGIKLIVNKNLAMANISKDQARQSAIDLADSFVRHFMVNYEKYELDPSDFPNLCAHYRNFIMLAFSRPIGAGERGGILHQIMESFRNILGGTPEPKRGGLTDWIKH